MSEVEKGMFATKYVPLNELDLLPFQSRLALEGEGFAQLVESVREKGILEPLLTRPKKERFEILAGGRRFRAAEKAGLTHAPIVVLPVDDDTALDIHLIENIHRADLTEDEKRSALANYARIRKFTAKEIAKHLDVSYSWVCKYLPEEFKDKEKVEAGRAGGEASGASRREAEITEEPKLQKPTITPIQSAINPDDFILCAGCMSKVHKDRAVPLSKDDPEHFVHPTEHCRDLAKEKLKHAFKPPPPREQKPETNIRTLDSWKNRLADMKTTKSKDEIALLQELTSRGIPPETDQQVCLWPTYPDGLYRTKKIIYYRDDPAIHKGNVLERDEEITEQLERLGYTVLRFREGTVKDWADQVEEALKFE